MITKVFKTASMTLGLLLVGATSSFAYTVEKGDTLSKIADTHNMSLNSITALNPQIKDVNLIYVGEHVNTNHNNNSDIRTNDAPRKVTTSASAYEEDLLARLVEAEAKGEPYAGKVAVAYVVMNRVDHKDFPNTIDGVIRQRGQFTPVSSGTINQKASADSVRAVQEALGANRKDSQSLFFYNSKIATSRWLDSRPTVTVIGNHTFKK